MATARVDLTDRAHRPAATLSPRERQILVLLARRWTDKEIADALYISPRTVMTHASSIFTKLGVANRREAATLALRHELV
jgi:DNA-binding NarL/FixJ family response regulator